MQPVVKNASVWAFSALFGCISLFGPGWHSFVGREFYGHAACQDHHHALAAGHDCDAASEAGAASVESDHDCPICGFFAQAQWALGFKPAVVQTPLVGVAPKAEESPRLIRLGVYRSRAPPLGLPIL